MLFFLALACVPAESPAKPDDSTVTSPHLELQLEGVQNLLLVQVDAFRYDHMGLYGYSRATTPDLEGVWHMDGMVSAAPWTAPSVSSLMSGMDPQRHGVRYNVPTGFGLNAGLAYPTFAELLRDEGFSTFLASGNSWVSPTTGIGNGFNEDTLSGKRYPQGNLDAQDLAFEEFLINRDRDQPFFAMLHTMDTHSPYFAIPEVAGTWATDVPFSESEDFPAQEEDIKALYGAGTPGVVDAVNAVYDEQILGLDHQLMRLQQTLAAHNLLKNTLVVLTADHGEMLGEDGRFGHMSGLDTQQVHIPLILLYPGLSGEAPACLSENVDTMPTILTAIGVPVPDTLDGHPLQAGCRSYARSSLYGPDGMIIELMVEDGVNRVSWSCHQTRVKYERTDGGRPTTAEARTLFDQLKAFDDDVIANVPGQDSCNFPEWDAIQ